MKKGGEWRVASGEKFSRYCRELNNDVCAERLAHFHTPRLKSLLSFFTYNSKLRTYDFIPMAQLRLVMVLLVASIGGCGYHVAGRGDKLPKSIHVIAVPTLGNKTTSYRIEQRLTAATVHEFLAKTTYRVISDPASGDAVLRGKVLSLEAVPLLFETKTGRATTMLVSVKCEVTFQERETGKILYHTDNFLFRNQYEISTDVKSFFEEQDPALDRLAQDFAARLVAAVTENF